MVRLLATLLAGLTLTGPASAQEIFRIQEVPLQPEGDGLFGTVDLRARPMCHGAQRTLQMAVDRISITGIRTLGETIDIKTGQGYSRAAALELGLPQEVEGGLIYLSGWIELDGLGRPVTVKKGSISPSLNGFLDWLTVEESDAVYRMTCQEWKERARDFDQTVIFAQHALRIKEAYDLGDGLFFDLKSAIRKAQNMHERLNMLGSRIGSVEKMSQINYIISELEAGPWVTPQQQSEAARLLAEAEARRQSLAEEKDEDAGEENASCDAVTAGEQEFWSGEEDAVATAGQEATGDDFWTSLGEGSDPLMAVDDARSLEVFTQDNLKKVRDAETGKVLIAAQGQYDDIEIRGDKIIVGSFPGRKGYRDHVGKVYQVQDGTARQMFEFHYSYMQDDRLVARKTLSARETGETERSLDLSRSTGDNYIYITYYDCDKAGIEYAISPEGEVEETPVTWNDAYREGKSYQCQ